MPSSRAPICVRTVPAVVLAAGQSLRMGQFKPLLDFDGRPMIVRVVETLRISSAIDPIYVVTGHETQQIRAALAEQLIHWVHNPDFKRGEMLSSIQQGLRALPAEAPAVLLVLGDQPAICPHTVTRLVQAFRDQTPPLVIPTLDGQRGHPILLSRQLIAEVLALPIGQSLKTVVYRHLPQAVQLPVADPAILLDVDEPADYQAALALWRRRHPSVQAKDPSCSTTAALLAPALACHGAAFSKARA